MRKVGAQFPQRLKQLRIEQNLLQKDTSVKMMNPILQ